MSSAAQSGRITVRCNTSGPSGREYDVTFDREGLVVLVENISMYGKRRTTWYFMSDKPMGLTAKVAVQAARKVLAAHAAAKGAK